MNLQNFKLLKEDYDSYHVGHPNGRSIVVSKKGLSDKAHEVIKKLKTQHLDSGGLAQAEIDDDVRSMSGAPEPIATPGAQPMSAPIAAEAAPAPMDPLAEQANAGNDALQEYKNTVQQGVNAEAQLGNKTANILGDTISNGQELMEQAAQDQKTRRAKDAELFDAYASGKIDPDRFWHNKSNGSKLLAGIGILFSGMGSANSGQPNYAIQQIDNAIKEDIEAQKNDQSKTLNLYKLNREAMHSDAAAALQTYNQFLNLAKLKVEQASAVAQSPLAQEKRAQTILAIDQQMAANRSKMAMLSGGGSQGMSKTDPAMLVPQLVPKEHQKEVTEEIKQAQIARQSKDTLLKLFDQAAKEQTLLGTGLGLRDSAAVKSLGVEVIPVLRDAAGKVSDTEMHAVKEVFPAGGDTDDRIATKRKAFDNLLEKKSIAPTAKQYGIDLDKFASTSLDNKARFTPQQKQFYDWAKANPGNPKSAMVLQKLGVH